MKKILIVDDDISARTLLNRILTVAGYEVHETDGAEQAIDIMLHESFDVAIIDYSMPSMSGIELLDEITKQDIQVSSIMITALSQKEIAIEALRAGAKYFMNKPFSGSELIFWVEDVINRRQDKIDKESAILANNLKSEFLTNMSHELRTPLHAIMGYSKLGRKKGINDPEKADKFFTEIYNAGNRLLVLINNMLDLAKLEAGKMVYSYQDQHLSRSVETIIRELSTIAQEKRVELKFNQILEDDVIVYDEHKIMQVVRNLVSNSLKFSPGESVIKITLDKSSCGGLQVTIEDQGPGIPEKELKCIFDKFTQSSKTKTNAGGTGLGLTVSHELIKGHGGKIWAENNPNGGAKFCFILYRGKESGRTSN